MNGHPLWTLRPWERHSFVLAVAGGVYVCYGAALIMITPDPVRVIGLIVAMQLMPLKAWGVVWVIVGVLALASTRWPPGSETWGYGAMSGLAAFWGAVYAVGMIFFSTPTISITAVLVWALMSFLWWAISGLENPRGYVEGPESQGYDDPFGSQP